MSKNEKLIALVAGGVILYELWKRNQAPASTAYVTDSSSPLPIWSQQLAQSGATVSTTITDTVSSLMSIPQGPGGTYVDYGQGGPGLFSAECLLGGLT